MDKIDLSVYRYFTNNLYGEFTMKGTIVAIATALFISILKATLFLRGTLHFVEKPKRPHSFTLFCLLASTEGRR